MGGVNEGMPTYCILKVLLDIVYTLLKHLSSLQSKKNLPDVGQGVASTPVSDSSKVRHF